MIACVVAVLLCAAATAQQGSDLTLDVSQTLFGFGAALNDCGYDTDLRSSEPLRQELRAEVAKAADRSPATRASHSDLCRFFQDHRPPGAALDFAPYITLALNVSPPPHFELQRREADLPPDAGYVLGVLPLLQRFYVDADLGSVWRKHAPEYEALIQRYHAPVAGMITAITAYLKMPEPRYVGRQFTIYLEPMAAPSQVNARNFGSDYFAVVAPDNGALQMAAIRHAYLHYLLDPMTLKRANVLKKLDPLLSTVKSAPLADEYKYDTALLVTECLIRAIEARTLQGGKAPEADKRKLVEASTREGFILTGYFYNALAGFEKEPTGLPDAFGDLLYNIDLGHEKKLASEVHFSARAAPELVHASRPAYPRLLDVAEDRLAAGDVKEAERLARQALESDREDPGRALFILARAATLERDVEAARTYFERTLQVARDPRLVAWSHIYLGRLFDLEENRASAVQHYRAALAAGDTMPDTRRAAERGLQEPYQPPAGADRHTP